MRLPAPRLPGLVLGVALALAATPAARVEAEEAAAVAELTSVAGEVAVIDGETGREVKARQVGARVRRGAVSGGDTVRTGSGGRAVLAFDDGSELRLGPSTEIEVRVVDLTQLVAAGQGDESFARRLLLAAGEIEGQVVANPEVSTELKSPGGVATLEQATLAITADLDRTRVRCTGGEASFRQAAAGLTLPLSPGLGFELERQGEDRWQLTVDGDNPGPLPIRLANGRRLAATPGARMTARLDDFAVELRVDRGQVVPESERAIAAPAAPPAFDPDAPPAVVFRVEEGSVEITNERQGLRMFLDEGFRTTLTDTFGGELEIVADPWNPGDLVVEGAGRINIAPGSTVEAATGSGGLEAETTAGVAVLTTPGGEQRPLIADTPPAAPAAAPSPRTTAQVNIEVEEGQVQLTNRQQAVTMTLDEGFGVSLAGGAGGELEIVTPPSNPGALVVEGKGSVAIDPGSKIETTSAPAGLEAEIVSGSATVTPPPDSGGEVYIFGNSDAESKGDAPVTVAVEEGRIDLFNRDHGMTLGLDEGFGVTLANAPGGGLQIITDPDNPGALTVSQGGGSASVASGSTVQTSSSRQRLDVTVVSGSATVSGPGATTSGGGGGSLPEDDGGGDDDDFFNQSLPPMACGECGVSDGFGGCIDVNSLCPDEACLIGRTCSSGQCVGGRAPASGEDPNCP